MSMSTTRHRRRVILELVREREIETQEELACLLADRGFAVSQSSVSRDMAALGLVKRGGRYAPPPPAPQAAANPLEERIRANVLAVDRAGDHLVVLHTPPGEASAVALALDRLAPPGLVGTVAGDDTIFAAVEGAPAGASLIRRLRRLMVGRSE